MTGNQIKVALVCDDLIQRGGQERVVLALSEMFPDAPIYTSMYTEEWEKTFSSRNKTLIGSFMQHLPFKDELFKLYGLFFLYNIAFQSFRFDDFDVVISVSSRYAHGIITRPCTKHICYLNSPGRMFWMPHSYFSSSWLAKLLSPILSFSRLIDYVSAQSVDLFIANSTNVQKRIKKYYGRDSVVVYPFFDFGDSITNVTNTVTTSTANYFVLITRLVDWKRLDVAVQAFKDLGFNLKIIGEGPDKQRLIELAGKSTNIEFLGYVPESQKISLITGCEAVVQTQYEDFGIVPVEAHALGKPVIAYGKGGATETIIDGVTGVLYKDQSPESLKEAVSRFRCLQINSQKCKEQSNKFSKQTFSDKIYSYVL